MFGVWIIISMTQIIPEAASNFLERHALTLRIMKSNWIVAMVFKALYYGLRSNIQYTLNAAVQGIASPLINHFFHSTGERLSETRLYL